MSFIRSTSNPESLYVYDDVNGYIQWYWHPKAPLRSAPGMMQVPPKAFYAACRQWVKKACFGLKCRVSVDGFTIEADNFYTKTGKRARMHGTVLEWMHDKKQRNYLIRVSYKKNVVHMWAVTWECIVDRFHLDEYKKWWLKEAKRDSKKSPRGRPRRSR